MDYRQRLEKLQGMLPELACDALLVEDSVNLFYLTGLQLSAGKLLVHRRGATLIVDGRYYEQCRKNSPVPVILSEQNRNALAELVTAKDNAIKTVAFNSTTTTYKNFMELQSALQETALLPVDNPVMKLRSIKSPEEIECLRKAAALGSEGFDYTCSLLKQGISEKEVAIELEIFWKRRGSKGTAFDPIIAFGTNTSMPHYRAGDAKLQKGDPVLIDIGVNYQHYHSDMTRVLFFQTADPRMRDVYNIVRQAQAAALTLCRPGTLIGDLDSAARNLISAHGYGANFTHSLGHGVGLEIHEPPLIRNTSTYSNIPLQAGMVITIEPGIYLPDIGGVRLEDTVVITADGYENLTNRPLEPRVI